MAFIANDTDFTGMKICRDTRLAWDNKYSDGLSTFENCKLDEEMERVLRGQGCEIT